MSDPFKHFYDTRWQLLQTIAFHSRHSPHSARIVPDNLLISHQSHNPNTSICFPSLNAVHDIQGYATPPKSLSMGHFPLASFING